MNPEISPELSHIVRRCLAKSPDDRFATAADVVSALDAVSQTRHLTPPPSLLSLFRRPVVLATTVLLILALAAAGLAMARNRIPRSLGAHHCRARDSAALESR